MDSLTDSAHGLDLSARTRPTFPSAEPPDEPSVPRVTSPSTPPPIGDTPSRPRSAHNSEYLSSGVELRRQLLARDLAYVLEIPSKQFVELLLVPLHPNIDVDAICQELDKLGLWDAHFGGDPADVTFDFDHLVPIFNEMCVIAKRNTEGMRAQVFRLQTIANTAPQADVIKSTLGPDAVFVTCVSPSSPSFSWHNIALPLEFKNNSETAKKVSKTAYCMQHIMAEDPCRRFTFGITIENTNMQLWFADRSILVRSEFIDFKKEKKISTSIFLSLAFASEVDMGWDPTITPVEGCKPRQYEINVDGESFTTLEIITSSGADRLLGRGGRVFKVVDKKKNVCALKDLWLDKEHKPERQIYTDLMDDIKRLCSEKARNRAAELLMTPSHDWQIEINHNPDVTKSCMLLARGVDMQNWKPLVVWTPRMANRDWTTQILTEEFGMESGSAQVGRRWNRKPEEIRHRRHYRVVLKEFATPMYKVTNLGDMCTIMADAIEVLKLMHECGWVHRDISVGNMYLHEGHGLLADLEYAKRTSDYSENEVRMGTIEFMALESIARRYFFIPPKGRMPLKGEITQFDFKFTHFALHDIESIWWTGIWVVFFHHTPDHEETEDQKIKRQKMTAKIFPGTSDYGSRYYFLEAEEFFCDTMATWPSVAFRSFINLLYNCLWSLLKVYRQTEATFPLSISDLSTKVEPRVVSRLSFPGAPKGVDFHSELMISIRKKVKNYKRISFVPIKNNTN